MASALAVGSLRHACTGCGGSCQGVRVRLVSSDEEARISAFGTDLGVDEPVQDGRLRFVDGRCVFLSAEGCRIHARWGGEAKPAVCRQYPLVAIDTGEPETGLRVGVDPGCYSAWRTRRDAPMLPLDGTHTLPVPLDAVNTRQEAFLLALLGSPGMTVPRALTTLLGGQPGDAFARRWLVRLQAAPLSALLARPEAGASVRAALAPTVARISTLDPSDPPIYQLDPEEDAWAIEVTRRLVGLRLVSSVPMVQVVALLSLGGAMACAWADPRPEPFARALSGWARALRAPIWWQSLVPDPAALRVLVAGEPG